MMYAVGGSPSNLREITQMTSWSLRTVLHVRVLLRPVTGGSTGILSAYRSWLVVVWMICYRIINTTFCGTALLYPICRNEKERQRSHCSLSKIPV